MYDRPAYASEGIGLSGSIRCQGIPLRIYRSRCGKMINAHNLSRGCPPMMDYLIFRHQGERCAVHTTRRIAKQNRYIAGSHEIPVWHESFRHS